MRHFFRAHLAALNGSAVLIPGTVDIAATHGNAASQAQLQESLREQELLQATIQSLKGVHNKGNQSLISAEARLQQESKRKRQALQTALHRNLLSLNKRKQHGGDSALLQTAITHLRNTSARHAHLERLRLEAAALAEVAQTMKMKTRARRQPAPRQYMTESESNAALGKVLCFSLVTQAEIDSGQAKIVHLLWRPFCDRHVVFGEDPARVRKDDPDFQLNRDVIVLKLLRASSHTGNWEKLAMAMVHIHDFFLPQGYKWFIKIDPDVLFFWANWRHFIHRMRLKWPRVPGDISPHSTYFDHRALFLGLTLFHHPPPYNSGHCYTLNNVTVATLGGALKRLRNLDSGSLKSGHDPLCPWDGPFADTFLPGCSLDGCKPIANIDRAKALCEAAGKQCGGIVHVGSGKQKHFELRARPETKPSSDGEVSFIKRCKGRDDTGDELVSIACQTTLQRPEDMQLGHCLKSLGIHPTDTRDAHGRERFSFTDAVTWDMGTRVVSQVPWYFRGRYFEDFGNAIDHLNPHIISVHVGYSPKLRNCLRVIYDDIVEGKPTWDAQPSHGTNRSRTEELVLTTAVVDWFKQHRDNFIQDPKCQKMVP